MEYSEQVALQWSDSEQSPEHVRRVLSDEVVQSMLNLQSSPYTDFLLNRRKTQFHHHGMDESEVDSGGNKSRHVKLNPIFTEEPAQNQNGTERMYDTQSLTMQLYGEDVTPPISPDENPTQEGSSHVIGASAPLSSIELDTVARWVYDGRMNLQQTDSGGASFEMEYRGPSKQRTEEDRIKASSKKLKMVPGVEERTRRLPNRRQDDDGIGTIEMTSKQPNVPEEKKERKPLQEWPIFGELPVITTRHVNIATVEDWGALEDWGARQAAGDRSSDSDSDRKCMGIHRCANWLLSSSMDRAYNAVRALRRVPKCVRSQSRTRLILATVISIFVITLILFLGLFPASFVYVEYYQVALKQSKVGETVDRDTIYYPGCYLLGPDSRFLTFQTTVHEITEKLDVFTLDTITIHMEYSVQYVVRPEEVADLYAMFLQDYIPFFHKVVKTMIRNTAATTLTVDDFRFNRAHVEMQLHAKLRQKLGGNCCPVCCKTGSCLDVEPYCSQCSQTGCDPGYHVDVRYFFLMEVEISSEVFERYMRRNVLEIEEEREPLLQDRAIIVKETEYLAEKHKNAANEIIGNATAHADFVTTVSTAESEKVVQSSYIRALKGLYSTLNITAEDHKLSLMMIRALADVSWNLYAGYGYYDNTLYIT